MIGKTIINGKDLFGVFGIYITEGGYNELISFPGLKQVTTIDWPEQDGEEVDLTDPVLDAKQVTISFAANRNSDLAGFLTEMSTNGYHTFDFNEIGPTFNLRLVSHPNLKIDAEGKPFLFSLTFSDDFPLSSYEYMMPIPTSIMPQGYLLDNKSLSDYGCAVLQGSLAEITKKPDVKTAQFRSFNKRPGLLDYSNQTSYDDLKIIKYKAKDVTINGLMRAPSLIIFWINYRALLWDFIRPGARTLQVPGISVQCYYKSSSVTIFYAEGGVWCQFTLTLRFI
jgi:hypothetical protein